jgi:hypothetical protein
MGAVRLPRTEKAPQEDVRKRGLHDDAFEESLLLLWWW